jgi:SAM-dependent methyltransferase
MQPSLTGCEGARPADGGKTGSGGKARTDEVEHDTCPACGGTLRRRRPDWILRCPDCGLWRSSLGASDGRLARSESLDEARRADGLRPVRDLNNTKEIRLVSRLRPMGGLEVLDVGAGHGWFLEAAALAGARAEGIEPDEVIAESARARGLHVTTGYFPDAVPAASRFDVICFHDVLEHIVDVAGTLSACRGRLRPNGVLVVSAPDAGGPLFQVARVLAALGFAGPFERLWQRGYPSPHVSYFDRSTLNRLAVRHGFRRRLDVSLPSLALRGLWSRVHMDRSPGVGSTLTYLGLAVAWLLLRFFPSDQRLHVFEVDPEP